MYQNCLIQFSVAEQRILHLRIYAKKIRNVYTYLCKVIFIFLYKELQTLSANNQIIHILSKHDILLPQYDHLKYCVSSLLKSKQWQVEESV